MSEYKKKRGVPQLPHQERPNDGNKSRLTSRGLYHARPHMSMGRTEAAA